MWANKALGKLTGKVIVGTSESTLFTPGTNLTLVDVVGSRIKFRELAGEAIKRVLRDYEHDVAIKYDLGSEGNWADIRDTKGGQVPWMELNVLEAIACAWEEKEWILRYTTQEQVADALGTGFYGSATGEREELLIAENVWDRVVVIQLGMENTGTCMVAYKFFSGSGADTADGIWQLGDADMAAAEWARRREAYLNLEAK